MDMVEQVFRDHATGRVCMSAKVHIELERGNFRAMPRAVPCAIGVKWVNVHPGNRKLGLTIIMDIFISSDPDTAYPLAITNATEITAYHTSAMET